MSLARCTALAVAFVSFAFACATPAPALAQSKPKHEAHANRAGAGGARGDRVEHRRKGSHSIGAPNAGHLEGGQRLKPSKHLAVKEGANAWGLPALAKMLKRASDKVAAKHKHSVLLVGDLSKKGGGYLEGHNSHQSGRDADVGFYIMNSRGKPAAARRFVAFDGAGKARDIEWARFDDARNWLLVETLLKDDANVHYLFVSAPLRVRLLTYAAKKRVPQEMMDRAAAALMSPKDVDVHDDHFHVRIRCAEGTLGGTCTEESTLHAAASASEALDGAQPAPSPTDPPAAVDPGHADEPASPPSDAPSTPELPALPQGPTAPVPAPAPAPVPGPGR